MAEDGFARYHPLVNFLFFVGAIGSAVVIQHPAYLLVSLFAGSLYYGILRGKAGLRLLSGLLPMVIFIAAVNPLFNTYGEHVLFHVFGKPYTLEALLYGSVLAGIFADMMVWFGCYNRVMTSDRFSALFGRRFPSLSLLLIMVLRMIPGFLRKAKQIASARKSIGKGAAGTFREKIRDGVTILSVMTDWVLEGGMMTADSMKARGYGSGRRESFQNYHMTPRDVFMLFFMGLTCLAFLLTGSREAEFTPKINIAPISWGLAAYGIFLMIPAAEEIKETVTWHILRSGISDSATPQEKKIP